MKFGPHPTATAAGCILAHSVRRGALQLRKGRRLQAADIAGLQAAGIETVTVARLETGDVHEDEAATRVAAAVVGAGALAAAPLTGRVNLFARHAGLLRLDVARIHALNAVDEGITLATLPPDTIVAEGQMLATIKIIPYAVPGRALETAVALAAGEAGAVRVARFRNLRVGLVLTRLADTRAAVLEKMRAAVVARLAPLQASLVAEHLVAHRADDVAAALGALLAQDLDAVLLSGIAATVDRADVVPAAIVAAGGELLHVGMPVDPGNLLLLARAGAQDARRIVGLPTCARSPKLNGFDFVLHRLATGEALEARDLMHMGVGGLLTDIPSRPHPRVPRKPV